MQATKYESLIKIIELGSFSGAAEELGYTPSGLNRMMSALEEDLGIQILNRTKKGISLTDAGKEVLPIIQNIIYLEKSLNEKCDEIKGLIKGNIKIGTIYSIASIWIPELVGNFKKLYPGITISVLQGSHQDLNEWFEEGKVDLIFTTKREDLDHWMTLKKDPVMVWLPENHNKADYSHFPIKDLENEIYIMNMPGADSDAEYLMNAENLNLNVQYTSLDNYTTYRMVEAGLGISMNNSLMSQNWNGKVVTIPLYPETFVELGIRYRENGSPSVKRLIETIKKWKDYIL